MCDYFFAFIGDNFCGIWNCYAEGYGYAIYPENENIVSFLGSFGYEAKFSVEILYLRYEPTRLCLCSTDYLRFENGLYSVLNLMLEGLLNRYYFSFCRSITPS